MRRFEEEDRRVREAFADPVVAVGFCAVWCALWAWIFLG